MATNFPSTLDTSTTLPAESASTTLATSHVTAHQNLQDAVEAIEAKIGVDSSAVTTSHDYKLGEVTSTDKAVGKTATQTLNNKTLTSPVVNVGSDATGDMYYRNAGVLTRIPVGTDNQIMKLNGTTPNWEAETTITDASYSTKGIVQGLTDAATSGLTIASGVISVNNGTTANKILKLDSNAKIPAVNGSLIDISSNTSIWEIVTSASTQHTNSASVNFPSATTPVTPTKFKESVYNDIAGTITVGWAVGLTSGGGSSTPRSQVYVNGVAVGSTHDGSATYSENISVNTGDLVQVYAYMLSYVSGNAIYNVNTLTFKYTKQIKATYVASTSNS